MNILLIIKYYPYILFIFNNMNLIMTIILFIYNNSKKKKENDEKITEWITVNIK